MARKREDTMSYFMRKNVLPGLHDSRTIKTYKTGISNFVDWTKSQNLKKPSLVTVDIIQAYEKELEKRGCSPATIHTRLAPVCKGFKISMAEIDKPRRKSAEISRSRMSESNLQGKREAVKAKFARLTAFQRVVGIRRAELRKLRAEDVQRRNGVLCVHVRQGKGGKEQWQHILPKDEKTVLEIVEGLKPEDKIFTEYELNNKIDLHGLRAAHARDCYDYYLAKLQDPEYRLQAINDLVYTFADGNKRLERKDPDKYNSKLNKFLNDITNEKPYKLRGDNRIKALEEHRPLEYDRLALMMVSVYHLSHWRLDVTVTNYML